MKKETLIQKCQTLNPYLANILTTIYKTSKTQQEFERLHRETKTQQTLSITGRYQTNKLDTDFLLTYRTPGRINFFETKPQQEKEIEFQISLLLGNQAQLEIMKIQDGNYKINRQMINLNAHHRYFQEISRIRNSINF